MKLSCPVCHEQLSTDLQTDWQQQDCPKCGHTFRILSEAGISDLCPGAMIGRFELQEQIGRGGFGSVWRAYDPQLDRTVALKTPRAGELTLVECEMFLREGRAAAQVRHPNVVAIYEVGRDGDRLYLVSQLIEGESLENRLKQSPPSARQVAIWSEQIARALYAVHNQGVIHRDLKPSNILLDCDSTPYLVDFGLARRQTNELSITSDGLLVGTVAYASPEQVKGDSHGADHRSDIFSFGTMLYQLLTGELPFRGAYHSILRQILEEEPIPPRQLNELIPRELETICLKCLEKSRNTRPESAEELADEFARFLRGEPIRTRPMGRCQRLARWANRNPLRVSLAAAVILIAVAGPMTALRLDTLHDRAVAAKNEADANAHLANDNARNAEVKARESRANARLARRHAYAADINNVLRAMDDGDSLMAKRLLEQHIPKDGEEDMRGFEWRYLWKRCHLGLQQTIQLDREIHEMAVSKNGKLAAVADNILRDVRIRLIDLDSERILIDHRHDSMVTGMIVDDAGNIHCVDRVGKLVLMPADDHGEQESRKVDAHTEAWDIAISEDGSRIFTVGDDGTIKVWSRLFTLLDTLPLPQGFRTRCMALSPSGEKVAVCGFIPPSGSAILEVLDVETGMTVWKHHFGHAWNEHSIEYSPDGGRVASIGKPSGGAPLLWNASTGEALNAVEEFPAKSSAWCGFSPDGRYLAAFGEQAGNVYVWDVQTLRRIATSFPHSSIMCAAWCDATTLATAGSEGCIKRWTVGDTTKPRRSVRTPLGTPIWSSSCSADGSTLAIDTGFDAVMLFDALNLQMVHMFPRPDTKGAAMLSDGSMYATNKKGTAVFHLGRGETKGRVAYEPDHEKKQLGDRVISPDERWLGIAEAERVNFTPKEIGVVLVHRASGMTRRLSTAPYQVMKFAFSHDSARVYTLDVARRLRIWEIASGQVAREFSSVYGRANATSIRVHPKETQVAIGDTSGNIVLFDMANGQRAFSFSGIGMTVRDLKYSRDGDALIAALGNRGRATDRGEIRFWDTHTGQLIVRLGADLGPCVGVTFVDNEIQMTTSHFDGSIVAWTGATDAEVAEQRTRTTPVLTEFTPHAIERLRDSRAVDAQPANVSTTSN